MSDNDDVQAADITPDDFMADEQESTKADSSTVKEAKAEEKPEAKDTKEDSKEEAEVAEGVEDAKPDEGEEVEKPEDKPKDEKPLAPKSENRFQKLANENRSLKEQVEALTSQVYEPQTAEELTDIVNPETGEKYTKTDARVVALEQKLELQRYNERVTNAQTYLGNEAMQVINDYPVFNPDSDQYDKELATEAADLLEGYLIRDPNVPEIDPNTGEETGQGIIIGSNVSPRKLYQTLARAQGASVAKGQLKGQQDTEQMLANADTNSSTAPEKKVVDPVIALWQED